MTKQDYIKIANILHRILITLSLQTSDREYVLNEFITLFKEENDNFDEEKFRLEII